METTNTSAESITEIIKTIEEAKSKNSFEKILDWGLRLAIGGLIWFSAKTVEKVDMFGDKINDLGSKTEIMQHDMEIIRRDMSKMENSIDKLSDKP